MILIKRAITLPRDLRGILSDIATQQQFLSRHIRPVTSQFLALRDGSIDESDIQKIFKYYGLAVPAILGEAFCLLRGKPITEQERICSTSQGAMTGLFDDFFDKQFLEEDKIQNTLHSNVSQKQPANEKLFAWFYQNALNTSPNSNLTKQRLMEVYYAQVESKKQTGRKLSEDQLLSITLKKGSASLLFYYAAFQEKDDAVENSVIAALGGWMQFANDIFDAYKDRESGIDTLVTTCTNIGELRSLFLMGVRSCYQESFKLPFPNSNISAFLNRLSIGIFSRCLVCLNQFEENQKLSNGVFIIQQYSRKQLVCDMDTSKNKIRSLVKHLMI